MAEQKCPQDCGCPKHDYENRVRSKPSTLDEAIVWVMCDHPSPHGSYTAGEMKEKLEQLGWDFPFISWLDVYDAMCKVLGEPTRKETKKL